MNQQTSYEIHGANIVTKVLGLDEADNSNRYDHKDSDCMCYDCIQDKQYLVWELEA